MSPSPNGISLKGRAALVTGASRGIGREIALAFADAGADVSVLARSSAELDELAVEIRDRGRKALPLPCDVTELDQITSAVDQTLEGLGTIDILVNNAGGPLFTVPFLDIRPEGWRRTLELNLLSVAWVCQAVGAHMVERRTGSIINIDSMGGSHPAPLVSPYCAAKAAVINLTQALAQEWGGAGVRVNAVGPGWIRTHLSRRFLEHPEVADGIARRVPLGRWGEPEDLVGVAVWLASDASSYVTGARIPVDGGIGVAAPQAPSGPLVATYRAAWELRQPPPPRAAPETPRRAAPPARFGSPIPGRRAYWTGDLTRTAGGHRGCASARGVRRTRERERR